MQSRFTRQYPGATSRRRGDATGSSIGGKPGHIHGHPDKDASQLDSKARIGSAQGQPPHTRRNEEKRPHVAGRTINRTHLGRFYLSLPRGTAGPGLGGDLDWLFTALTGVPLRHRSDLKKEPGGGKPATLAISEILEWLLVQRLEKRELALAVNEAS